ncbi:MAG: methylenetetrahydrofolate reductase, partial [Synergistaceae bacterium]|nr:methylenetetrahydrofolate reductase [Synergistaceae bacterium]
MRRVLESGHFSFTAEIGPPMSGNAENIREKARKLKGCADAANITDNQTAIVRMSSIAAGYIASCEGVEPVIQMTCRDRNRIALQSDLLGAHALGLRNVLILSGDHQSFGNHQASKNVYDVDSVQFL